MRIVSICPSNTELCAYLNLTSQLVGVDDFSDWPESIQGLPRLGPDLSIDMEKVQELKPDLILASLSVPGMEKNIEALEKLELNYTVLNPNSLDDICKDLVTLGELTNKREEAIALTDRIQHMIHEYKQISSSIQNKPEIYWEWWPKPIFTPGKTNWLTEISDLAGAKNIFRDVELASVQTDWEDVVARKPDHICLAWVGVRKKKVNPIVVKKREGWEELGETPIHILEEWLYCRPSPRLLTGLVKLAAILHPDHYPAYDGKDPFLS
ncbi:cobalamin-binding protein [Guptibacillus algicola]|uniref:cobalamin-binding protein n=1 Tax=Guptibacillus algicola TaxID=225844 RepID=UPI001CD5E065|nr:cobalamin-binding protein [Alkalihalobacillus algicola]MCA0986611.1 cobalamin-binding protein [Alkalihalobacillus algicola]